MKATFVVAGLLAAMPAFAVEQEVTHESHFHLITTKCEVEAENGAETTPQSPPLDVDDPGTPGCNRWEINVTVDGDITHSQRSWELPLLDINYGVGDNLQLKYELPYLSNAADGASISAIGESEAGIKYLFYEDEASKTQLAVYPQLTFVRSDSDVVLKGLATPGSIITLPVLMTTKIGQTGISDINLTADLGYNISNKTDTADFINASVGIGTALSTRVGMMAELATEQAVSNLAEDPREQLIKTDLGLMTTVSRQFLIYGAVGHSLHASDTQDHSYVLAGFRLLTGGGSQSAEKVAVQ